MRFKIRNFGPIVDADLKLGMLNVFTGGNSVGKSYIHYLIWCLMSTEPNFSEILSLASDKAREYLKSREPTKLKEFVIEFFERFDTIWKNAIIEQLKDTFVVNELSELILVGEQESIIDISNDKGSMNIVFRILPGGLEIGKLDRIISYLDEKLGIDRVGEMNKLSITIDGEEIYSIPVEEKVDELAVKFASTIPHIYDSILDGFIMYSSTYILPDGRAGLLRARETLLYYLLSVRERVFMNSVDRSFIRDLEALSPLIKCKKIAALSSFLERKLGVYYKLGREPPRYTVKIQVHREKTVELPLVRAPSGIRELAPLVYLMKHALEGGDILFIEEPEAHLHPDAQSIVVRTLAGLTNEQVRILMTTHSIHVLDELSNLLRLAKLSPDEKMELGYNEWEGISPDIVRIYHVRLDGRVKEVKASDEGLDETGLDEVVGEIARLHASVERRFYGSRA